MRVPWFNWRASGRSEDASLAACDAPGERTPDEILLALRLIPRYHIRLTLDSSPMSLYPLQPLGAALTAMLGMERAQRALGELAEGGFAIIATCPLELAEHYRDELTRYGAPCDIQPV